MAQPLADTDITKWASDYTGADTNEPAGTLSMAGILDDEFRLIKSVVRAESENKQWERWALTPTFVSATQFTLVGDQTSAVAFVNRRIKATVTAGTVYGYISAAVFTTLTTITVVLDSGALDSGLSEVQFGALSDTNGALPQTVLKASTALLYAAVSNGGSGNAYTGTLNSAITAYLTGQVYRLKFTQANPGGPVTVALNGLAALTVKKFGTATDLVANDIPAGAIVECQYDGTVLQMGVPLQAQLGGGYGSASLGGNVTVDTTGENILTLAVTAPSTGGPYRLLASYYLALQSSVNSIDFAVSDGTNTWAPQTARDTTTAVAASMISPTTYAAGAAVTLNLKGKASSGSGVVQTTSPGGLALASRLVADFIPSN